MSATDAAPIDVRDLQKTYYDGLFSRRRVEALRGVSLAVQRGEIFGLLGPNGAGKTTLIKVLLGIVRKSEGEARLLGYQAGDRSARRRVGYLPESHRIPQHLTAYTALEYYGMLSGLSAGEVKRRRDAALATVNLSDWGRTSVRKYSKGMLQRLGLAQAMLHDPDLLILDEPTDGVDPVGRTEIRRVLKELKAAGKTVFLNSHLLQELELVCDRVAILDHGRVLRVATVQDLTGRSAPTGTEGAAFDVVFRLLGDVAAIRAAIPQAEVNTNVGAEVQATASAAGQEQVNRWVDALRGQQVSIVSMERRRATLEEAFLEIVSESQPKP